MSFEFDSATRRQLGYKCHILDPHEHPPAADVAAHFTRADYGDAAAIEAFSQAVDVVTYEFENLPVAPLRGLGEKLRPGARSLAVAQDHLRETKHLAPGVRVLRTI